MSGTKIFLKVIASTTVVIVTLINVQPPAFGTSRYKRGRRVVVMSMDGFRHDYLGKANTPNFDALIETGVKVPWVEMTFLTATIPSHYTIATGRFEESHGVVGNTVPEAMAFLGTTKSRWWDGAEPVWITAVKEGLKVGVYFWPGSETDFEGYRPTSWKPYDVKVSFEERIDTLVDDWLGRQDYALSMIYFDEPDHSGHTHGPDAPEMIPVIERMDRVLGYFIQKLKDSNLTDKVDFIVTSDHGMTSADPERRIQLSDYVNETLLEDVVWGGAFAHLVPRPGKVQALVDALSGIEHLTVYRKEDIPEEFHYKHHHRIMPVLAVADEGWDVRKNFYPDDDMRGHHGFKGSYMNMRPIFIASGPSFKNGEEAAPFMSVDIYPLLCHLLDFRPLPNNGSLSKIKHLLRTDKELASVEDGAMSTVASFRCIIISIMLSWTWLS